jgi:hypothetical protein
MKFIFTLFAFLALALPATAQTAGGQILDTVFGAEEKKIITDYLTQKMGLPETTNKSAAKKTDDDEDNEPKTKGKKNKKAKKNKGKNKKMPPGLAKRKTLPPGLAKRHTLPPGLAVRELPDDLVSQLPPPAEGSERIIADENIVLIEKATGRVLDIILGGQK